MSPLYRGTVLGRVSAVMAGTRAGRAHPEGRAGHSARRGRAPGRGRNLILLAALLAALGVLAGCGTAAKPVATPDSDLRRVPVVPAEGHPE